jgi:hypothetical protein
MRHGMVPAGKAFVGQQGTKQVYCPVIAWMWKCSGWLVS